MMASSAISAIDLSRTEILTEARAKRAVTLYADPHSESARVLARGRWPFEAMNRALRQLESIADLGTLCSSGSLADIERRDVLGKSRPGNHSLFARRIGGSSTWQR